MTVQSIIRDASVAMLAAILIPIGCSMRQHSHATQGSSLSKSTMLAQQDAAISPEYFIRPGSRDVVLENVKTSSRVGSDDYVMIKKALLALPIDIRNQIDFAEISPDKRVMGICKQMRVGFPPREAMVAFLQINDELPQVVSWIMADAPSDQGFGRVGWITFSRDSRSVFVVFAFGVLIFDISGHPSKCASPRPNPFGSIASVAVGFLGATTVYQIWTSSPESRDVMVASPWFSCCDGPDSSRVD
jgi:hypothetical protein